MLKRLADLSKSEFSARVGCINAVPCTEVFKLTMEYLLLTGSELANSKACYIDNKKLSIVFFGSLHNNESYPEYPIVIRVGYPSLHYNQ